MKLTATFALLTILALPLQAARPNIILVMTDDQGWGQMGYYDHPALKTPNLDAMAGNGLRLDRFYAGAPNCSPTRATVMTGRTNDRTGVENHGYPLRLQEKTLPRALQKSGYATGHFGKWHLNGYRGPGAPIFGDDDHGPGPFGFDEWVSVSNFFDRDPLMSRQGKFEDFRGDSSEIIVDEALKFIGRTSKAGKPFFVVIWYGTPHSPMVASEQDRASFQNLDKNSSHHYGELVAMDRSIGTLRHGLRKLKIDEDTLVWFNSDNGGLPKIKPATVGGLRGFKGSVYEGGLRVPCVIEWPAVVTKARISQFPAATTDIFPTIADIVGLPKSALLHPIDGTSIRQLFSKEIGLRKNPLGFRHTNRGALLDNDYKLVAPKIGTDNYELYNLVDDPNEENNLRTAEPQIARRLIRQFTKWNASVEASVTGKDYPSGKVNPDHPTRRDWTQSDKYRPYFKEWSKRPEYSRLKPRK
jgi:arylsulfatase A-like enzyme